MTSDKATRPVVLVAIDWYLPAYRAGGPIRSIANLVAALGDEIDFRIVCGNRDLGESEDLQVKANTWTTFGKSQVQYLPQTIGRPPSGGLTQGSSAQPALPQQPV